MLAFDTADVPVHQRRGLIVDSITRATSATSMTLEVPSSDLHLTMRSWDLGGVELVDAQCSGHTLRRTTHAASDEESVLALTSGLKGRGVSRQHHHEVVVRPSTLWATELTAPHLHQVSDTRTITAKIPFHQLGIREDVVRPALEHAGTSPLAPLFRHHVAELRRMADDVSTAAALAMGTSTAALARAVLASVSSDERLARESLDSVLLVRIKAFVRAHLGDPDLNPAGIAAATHVSVRLLYKTCAQADLRLEPWIFEQRLERAHEELAQMTTPRASVAEVAHRWGFRSPSHFTQRFRRAYGLSPREWQAINRGRPTAGRRS